MFFHETSKKRNTVYTLGQVWTWKILRVRHREAKWRLAPTSRTRNCKTEAAIRMKLGSLVVVLAVYLILQTNPEYRLSSQRYTWPNRKWRYGGDPIFRLSDTDFLFDFLYPRTTTARRRAVKSCRTLTFTLLANQLDTSEPEVVSRGRP